MNFTRRRLRDNEPEINLIPLIDVLLVILIFLAASTTFLRQSALQVALPEARHQVSPPARMTLTITRDGRYALDGTLLDASSTVLSEAMRHAIASDPDAVLLIQADAQTAHQNVVNAMEAARLAGVTHVNFAAQP